MEIDAPVGAEDHIGGGPVAGDPHDALEGAVEEAASGAEDGPAQQVSGECEGHEPGAVGVEVLEREPARPGVLEPCDVLFDVCVGAPGGIEVDGPAGLVGVEASVAELHRWEQAALGFGAQWFGANDQPGPGWQLGVVDLGAELDHHRTIDALKAVAVERPVPHRIEAFVIVCRCGDPRVRADGHEESDVTFPTGGQEPFGAASRITPNHNGTASQTGVVTGGVAGGDLAEELRSGETR